MSVASLGKVKHRYATRGVGVNDGVAAWCERDPADTSAQTGARAHGTSSSTWRSDPSPSLRPSSSQATALADAGQVLQSS
jgi:hypothetical protein